MAGLYHGRYLATNSADRHVRLFDVSHVLEAPMHGEAPEPIGKMSDTISRTRWNSLMFSGDGELVLAGTRCILFQRQGC